MWHVERVDILARSSGIREELRRLRNGYFIYRMEEVMRQNLKLKGRLQNYLSWPLILMIPFIIINIPVYLENVEAGGLISAFLVVYFVCLVPN